MTEKTTGGPAFPRSRCAEERQSAIMESRGADQAWSVPGLTIRDYFAAKAMQAAATNPKGADGFTFAQRAEWAYMQADAMLEARK